MEYIYKKIVYNLYYIKLIETIIKFDYVFYYHYS
ncbi:hypothetical protein C8P70_10746 [Myroides indicus]|uniref:Uncharacterized protein n=1 Tax=Myroides indicus TaxID=1323422 RepID=A0A4R7EZX1_9FLAO|nr:hypothetical protein C8P70_10746 [Myroides indicus]